MTSATRGRIGRPPKPPVAGERVSLGLKVTADIKARLDRAARDSGLTQSQEAENRIVASFERIDLLTDVLSLAYGRRAAGILMMLGSAMNGAGVNALLSAAGGPLAKGNDFTGWIDDPDAYEQAKQSVAALLDALRPEGQVSNPHGTTGRYVAEDILRTVREHPKADKDGYVLVPTYAWAPETVRSLLGPTATRMAEVPPNETSAFRCCSWCDQSLAPDRAEAVLARIGAQMRESNVSALISIVMPSLDARVCSLCDQPIPPDKVDEIMDRAKQMLANMRKHEPQDEPAVLNFQGERAKRLKGYGS